MPDELFGLKQREIIIVTNLTVPRFSVHMHCTSVIILSIFIFEVFDNLPKLYCRSTFETLTDMKGGCEFTVDFWAKITVLF